MTLAEAGEALGGHVSAVARLPGMATWQRVIDYRVQQIRKLPNVDVYRQSELDATQVLAFGFDHIAVATGSGWRRDGRGRRHPLGIPIHRDAACLTPDDIVHGAAVAERVLIYDDDHYFMASVLAEKLSGDGVEVVYVTPAPDAATWTHNTLEQARIQARLLELGVALELSTRIETIGHGGVELSCVYSGRRKTLRCGSVVLVTMREPDDALFEELDADRAALSEAGIKSVTRVGDCLAPGLLAAAVYSGHRYARELDGGPASPDVTPFRREVLQPDHE